MAKTQAQRVEDAAKELSRLLTIGSFDQIQMTDQGKDLTVAQLVERLLLAADREQPGIKGWWIKPDVLVIDFPKTAGWDRSEFPHPLLTLDYDKVGDLSRIVMLGSLAKMISTTPFYREPRVPDQAWPIQPGIGYEGPGVYEHYKGDRYRVIGLATDEADLSKVSVIYRADGSKAFWSRPLEMFNSQAIVDGSPVARFRKMS